MLLSLKTAVVSQKFLHHISEHGLNFPTLDEFHFRQDIFLANDADNDKTNADPNNTFTVGHNFFSTMTPDERKQWTGLAHDPSLDEDTTTAAPLTSLWNSPLEDLRRNRRHHNNRHETAPQSEQHQDGSAAPSANLQGSVDWRSKMPAIKNQKGCVSCWVFATTAVLEATHAIETGRVTSLSEQQVLDCNTNGKNCHTPGVMWDAMNYFKQGMVSSASYPYTMKVESCRASQFQKEVYLTEFAKSKTYSSSTLISLLNTAPVAVTISSKEPFYKYKTGIINSLACGTSVDHTVALVGYGTQGSQQYYIVRNSWGTTWGMEGYAYVATQPGAREDGFCGIQRQNMSVSSTRS